MRHKEKNKMGFKGNMNIVGGKIEGVGTVQGGIFGDLQIDGVCTIIDDLEADKLRIDGVCSCSGNIKAAEFSCDGVLTIQGSLRAGIADVDGVATVEGGKVEADRIECDGVLTVQGEISADVINAKGLIHAEEIVGDSITIKSYHKRGFPKAFILLGEKLSGKSSRLNFIEGTTVDLEGVHAESVSGRDVIIGKNCRIERVNVSGELTVHPSSYVGEVAR